MEADVTYDRTERPLEFWAATLGVVTHPCSLSEDDLEAIIKLALRSSYEGAPAHIKCLAHYALGKTLLLLRTHYPEWREWVGHAAVLAGEWAIVSGDDLLVRRCEALFVEYVRSLDH